MFGVLQHRRLDRAERSRPADCLLDRESGRNADSLAIALRFFHHLDAQRVNQRIVNDAVESRSGEQAYRVGAEIGPQLEPNVMSNIWALDAVEASPAEPVRQLRHTGIQTIVSSADAKLPTGKMADKTRGFDGAGHEDNASYDPGRRDGAAYTP